jgi:hypothetical protein
MLHVGDSAIAEFWRRSASRKGKYVQWEGGSPTRAKVRTPLAWVVSVEKTKRMKPTDKAILGMVSESPGRNESEPTSGLETKLRSGGRAPPSGRRQHGMARADRCDMTLRRGGRDSTVIRTCYATGEALLVPERNTLEQVRPITG